MISASSFKTDAPLFAPDSAARESGVFCNSLELLPVMEIGSNPPAPIKLFVGCCCLSDDVPIVVENY